MARISEMHYSNAYARSSGVDEFLEVALSPSEDASDFSVSFYNADGSLYLTVPLDDPGVQVSYDADADENVFVISSSVFISFITPSPRSRELPAGAHLDPACHYL